MTVTGSVMMRRAFTVAAACLALACSSELPTEVTDVDIRAAKGGASGGSGSTASGPAVGAAMPRAATPDTTLDVRIFGSGFSRGMVARWAIDSVVTSKIIVNSTRFISSSELLANITVTGEAPLTEYDIVVTSTKGGKPGIGTEIFEIVDALPSLGGNTTVALSINESGQIAGYSSLYVSGGSGADRPVIWENGIVRDLTPSGYVMGRAVDINESGEVTGWVAGGPTGGMVPFVWSPTTGMRFLPTLPGETQHGAFAINDAGVVAGWSGRAAVLWENGILRVIHNDPSQWSAASDINNLGEVVGYSEPAINAPPQTAWRWNAASGVQLLPTLQGNLGVPNAINDLGQIIGVGPSAAGGGAFIHENGVTRPLTSGSLVMTYAHAISEAGHVVGHVADGRGVMWFPDGTMGVICTPVPPANGYTTMCGAYGVNAVGTSVGTKSDKYGRIREAYVWGLTEF